MHTVQMEVTVTLTVGGVYARQYDEWDEVEVEDIFISSGGRQIDILDGVDRRDPAARAVLANLTHALGDQILDILTADYFADVLP